MQDKFVEEIKELKNEELIELYNKICNHINYLSSSIIEVVEPESVEVAKENDMNFESEGGDDVGDE